MALLLPRRNPICLKGWFRDLVACLLLVALVLLFHWRILTPDLAVRGSLSPGDFTDQFYAFARVEAEQLRQGQLPLWNPLTNSGHPFLADVQAAVFYPPSVLTALTMAFLGGSLFALEIEVVAHYCLAALFTYVFARRLLRTRGAAFVAACGFTFGGYLTGYPALQFAILKTDVWLPLILLGLEVGASCLETERRNASLAFLGAGLAFGLAILAGHPQSAMYVGYTSVAYLMFRLWLPPLRRRVPAVLAIFLLAALGLSAAQWLPSVEFMRLSSRTGLGYADLSNGYQLSDVFQLVLPSQSPLYVGIVPCLLAFLALAQSRARTAWFWGGLGLIALLLAFGGNLFFYPLFYMLAPGFQLFRSQERAVFLLSFSLAMLAGYGVDGWLSDSFPRRLPRLTVALSLGALGLAAMAYVGWLSGGEVIPSPTWWFLQQGSYLFLFLAGVSALAFWWSRRGSHPGMVVALLALILLDLFTANARRNLDHRLPEELVRPSPVIEKMRADVSQFRVSDEGQLVGNFGCLFDLEETGGASPLRLERYRRLIEEVPKEFVWRLLNVKYVTTVDSALQVSSEAVAYETTHLHRLAEPWPRAWVVHQVEVIPDDDATIARLSDWRFSPAQAAIVPSPLEVPLVGGSSAAASTVQWVRHEPSLLELDVDLPEDGLLVLSEIYYPGWKTLVDDQPALTLRADLTLRAVPLPAGSHRVKMVYHPWTVAAGIALSLLSLLGAVAVVAWAGRRRG